MEGLRLRLCCTMFTFWRQPVTCDLTPMADMSLSVSMNDIAAACSHCCRRTARGAADSLMSLGTGR